MEALGLKEGDEIVISIASKHAFTVDRDLSRQKARDEIIEAMRRDAWKLPEGFKFDREEANER